MLELSPQSRGVRVGYVVKRYPRYSETFIVNEVLAHESAGLPIEIFSLRAPVDSHFQDAISRVRAPVHYLTTSASKATEFWRKLADASQRYPVMTSLFPLLLKHEPSEVASAIALADDAIAAKITHLHAHFATSAADVTLLAHHLTGIPFTLTAHAKDIFHEDVDHARLATKISAAETTITVSDFNVNYLKRKLGEAAKRVTRIYNGLNLRCFPYCSPRDREAKILYVGRLVEKKGVEVLIDACTTLASRNRSFKTEIIGDGPLATALRNQVARLGIDHLVDFRGPQPQDVVKAALGDAAVFAAPCVQASDGNRDGLPTVLLESMARGTPCVSTDVTGIPEAVVNGKTGLIVPQRDAGALADALERLLFDSELRVQLAESARRHMQANFDIDRNAAIQRQLFCRSDTGEQAAIQRAAENAVAI